MEMLYTSISTSNWLLARNITSVGKLVSNHVGLPDEVKDAKKKNRDEFESSMHWEQEQVILLCVSIPPSQNLKERKTSWCYRQCDCW